MLSRNHFLHHRYRIVRPLGKGGFGQVYEALDDKLDCIVAIKERLANLNSDKLRRAFEREAKLLANLRHPVLPKVSDHFFEGHGQYLVMEFIEGDDLAMLLKKRKRPFAVEEVLPWADEVLRALEYLHSRSEPIVHRDIKPGNIKLTDEGEIFLLDFGLAKGAAGSMPVPDTDQRSSSLYAYTKEYAPLEQLNNSGTDAQSDLYALGATLYHLLTGRIPIKASTRDEKLDKGQRDPQLPAHEVNPAVPFSVSLALSQAMAIRRRDRTATATKLRQALTQARVALEEEYRRATAETDPQTDQHGEDQPTPQAGSPAGTTAPSPTAPSPTAQSPHVMGMGGSSELRRESNGETRTPIDRPSHAAESPSPERSAPAGEVSWPSQLSSENIDSQWTSTIVDEEASTLPQQQLDEEREAREREEQEREEQEREERERLERQRQVEEAARRAAEEEREREAEAERQRLRAEQERQKAEEEAARQAAEERLRREREEEERREAEVAAQRLAEQREVERLRAEAEERARQEEAERQRAEAERQRLQQEEEERRQAEAEAEARRTAEEERKAAEAEARRRDEEEARQRAKEEARRKEEARAEEEAQRKRAEAEANRRAEELAAEPARQRAQEAEREATQTTIAAETEAHDTAVKEDAEATDRQTTLVVEPNLYTPSHQARSPLPQSKLPRRWLIGGLIAVLFVAVITFALVFWRRSESSPVNENSNVAANENNSAGNSAGNTSPATAAPETPHRFSLKPPLKGQHGEAWSVAYSRDGNLVVSGGQDGNVRMWDTASWQLRFEKKAHAKPINSVAFSPDSRVVASGSSDNSIGFWNATDGASLKNFLTGHTNKVLSVVFSPDGNLLASASADKTVKLWDVKAGTAVRTLDGHTDEVWSVVFSPDGKTLASAGKDAVIRLWNVETGAEIKSLKSSGNIYSLAFSPDGATLASGHADGTIRLWDWQAGGSPIELKGHTDKVKSIAFSPDGSTLASASRDKSIKLWNIKAGKQKPEQTLTGHRDSVESVMFSPDGRTLVSGGQDQTVRVWQ